MYVAFSLTHHMNVTQAIFTVTLQLLVKH